MYKAKIDIGGYKKGETVPDELAEVWAAMYKVSPVEKVSGKEKKVIEEPKKKEREVSSSDDKMLDDYLGRNTAVVVKNLLSDGLGKETIRKLFKLEKLGKNRKKVIDTLKKLM